MASSLSPWPIALIVVLSSPAAAQDAPAPVAMSFEAASQTLTKGSRELSAADHETRAAQAMADSLKALRRPVV